MREIGNFFGGIQNPFHEVRRSAATNMLDNLILKLELEFTPKSRANLLVANELLKNNSLVLYANHTTMIPDAELGVSMALSQLSNAKRFIGPAAMKHYDFARDPKGAALFRALKLVGINIVPIVQPDDPYPYGGGKAKMIEKLRKQTAETMRLPGSVEGIFPEGTHSIDGKLQSAKKGIGYLEQYDPNLYYLPMAIVYTQFAQAGDMPKVEIGKPLRISDMVTDMSAIPLDPKERALFLTNIHMYRLAGMLPEYMRGVYGEGK